MKHASTMSIFNGIAYVEEAAEELPQFQRASAMVGGEFSVGVIGRDRGVQADAADEAHRVVQAAVGRGPQAVHGYNARMFEAAGDFRFEEEPLSRNRVVGLLVFDAFQGDVAIQLRVVRTVNHAEPAAGMKVLDPEPIGAGSARASER